MITFEQIKKDIKDDKLKFFGSSELFNKYNPININEIIAITIQEYAEYIYDKYNITYNDQSFRTSGSDLDLSDILKDHTETTGFYIDVYGLEETRIMIEITYPELDEYESLEEYIKAIQKLFITNSILYLEDFDADYEFDELYQPNPYIGPSELMEYLKIDEGYFKILANKLEKEYKQIKNVL